MAVGLSPALQAVQDALHAQINAGLGPLHDFLKAMDTVNRYQDITRLRQLYWGMSDDRKAKYMAHVQKLAAEQPDKFPLFVKLTLEYTTIRMER